MLKKALLTGLVVVLVMAFLLAPLAAVQASTARHAGGFQLVDSLAAPFKAVANPLPFAIACDGSSSGGSCGGG